MPRIQTVFGGDPDERWEAVRERRAALPTPLAPQLPSFADGWHVVAFSDELAQGSVLPVRALGRDLALYRGEDGEAHALDAHCPHLGAHLGHGGRVEGDRIVCPFHGWQWDGAGQCRAIPYAERIPAAARTRAHPLLDRNGFLFVWFHAEGDAPSWEIETIPEVGDADYRIVARRHTPWVGHLQDVVENGVDLQHFRSVHHWNPNHVDWQPDRHTYTMRYDIASHRKQTEGFLFDSKTDGPAFTRTRFWGLYHGVTLHGMTQVDDGLIELRQLYVYRNDFPDKAALRAAAGSDQEWCADIPIWENKRVLARPLLAEEDAGVPRLRAWFAQFHSAPARE